jgi:two-component system, NarL family, response regulator DevR
MNDDSPQPGGIGVFLVDDHEIAERMFLAEKTVKNYVSALLTKLGMQRRTQAAAFAVRHADDPGR